MFTAATIEKGVRLYVDIHIYNRILCAADRARMCGCARIKILLLIGLYR